MRDQNPAATFIVSIIHTVHSLFANPIWRDFNARSGRIFIYLPTSYIVSYLNHSDNTCCIPTALPTLSQKATNKHTRAHTHTLETMDGLRRRRRRGIRWPLMFVVRQLVCWSVRWPRTVTFSWRHTARSAARQLVGEEKGREGYGRVV